MSPEDYEALSEELDSALDALEEKEAKKGRSQGLRGLCRIALVAGGLAALAAAGFAAAGAPDGMPPHEERVAYLIREHPDTRFEMEYAPDFVLARGWITEREHVWVSLYSLPASPQLSNVLGVIDGASRDSSADGTLDLVWGTLPLGDGRALLCMVEYGNLPEGMREDLAGHYAISSEAYYLHFEKGLGEYESTAGEEEFREFIETSKGLEACGIIHPPR